MGSFSLRICFILYPLYERQQVYRSRTAVGFVLVIFCWKSWESMYKNSVMKTLPLPHYRSTSLGICRPTQCFLSSRCLSILRRVFSFVWRKSRQLLWAAICSSVGLVPLHQWSWNSQNITIFDGSVLFVPKTLRFKCTRHDSWLVRPPMLVTKAFTYFCSTELYPDESKSCTTTIASSLIESRGLAISYQASGRTRW